MPSGSSARGAHSPAPISRSCHSLYIHIPFCVKKCRYCDFLSGPQDEETRELYTRALINEIKLQTVCPAGTPVDTVFFGGGTPSVLSGSQIERIMEALYSFFLIQEDAEISMETNPGTADEEKLGILKRSGINRLSLGVQSIHDRELALLGRIHTADQARMTFEQARKAGFDNINIDLMSALPGQSFESWADTLEQAVRWAPDHISAYSLIIEEGTPFASMYQNGSLPALPDEDMDREMYHYTGAFLAEHGYQRYEISNYAIPGRECRHNSGYWTGHPYLGLGIGAASYVNGTRFSNCTDLRKYSDLLADEKDRTGGTEQGDAAEQTAGTEQGSVAEQTAGTEQADAEEQTARTEQGSVAEQTAGTEQADAAEQNAGTDQTGQHPEAESLISGNPSCGSRPGRKIDTGITALIRTDIHPLSAEEQMEEFMFLGLRMTEGVRDAVFMKRFGKRIDQVYGQTLEKHISQGVLERTPGGYRLTARGVDVSNYVLADYLLS